MSTPAATTTRLLLTLAIDGVCGQACVDWAVSMLEAGRDSPHLRQLAGAIPPHNHFELRELCERVLDELGEPRPPRDVAVTRYAVERLCDATTGRA